MRRTSTSPTGVSIRRDALPPDLRPLDAAGADDLDATFPLGAPVRVVLKYLGSQS